MAWWNRDRLYERLVQLVADLELVAERARGLDAAAGTSEDLPPNEYGAWGDFAESVDSDDPARRPLTDELRALIRRRKTWDDSDLAWGRESALRAYQAMHAAIPAVWAWTTHPGVVGLAAAELHRAVAVAEDEGLRVTTGLQDVRRNERRSAL